MKHDPARLAEIHALCFTETRAWSIREFIELREHPTSIIVAQRNGFAIGRIVADEAEILTIAVTPSARRAGTGRTLLADLEISVASAGAKSMFLEVSKENQVAIGLYTKAGFTQIGVRKNYYTNSSGSQIDGLILSKRLE